MKSYYLKILLATVIIVVVAASFFVISKSTLGKALSSLLGGAAGVAVAAGQQFKTCNKVGYFNVNKGCYLGIFAIIGFIGPTLFRFLWKVTGSRTNNKLVEKTAQVSNKSQSDIIDEIIPEGNINDEILDSNGQEIPRSSKIAGWKKAFNRKLKKIFEKSIKEQSMDPDKEAEDILDFNKNYEIELVEINKEALEEAKDIDADVDPIEVQDGVDISAEAFGF